MQELLEESSCGEFYLKKENVDNMNNNDNLTIKNCITITYSSKDGAIFLFYSNRVNVKNQSIFFFFSPSERSPLCPMLIKSDFML